MGRELKRVSLDFKWPVGQIWKGYINPYHSQQCKSCEGSGINPATRKLENDWFGWGDLPDKWVYRENGSRYNDNAWCYHLEQDEVDALIDSNRLSDLTKEFIPGIGWVKKDPQYRPTADEVNKWAVESRLGHDAINRWICVKTRAERLGVYGLCECCNGEGQLWASDEVKKLQDGWEPTEPPTGEGYQLWGTTSEGEPMTPVFPTLEELCQYCEDNEVSIFGKDTLTKDEWMNMLGDKEETPIVYTTKEGFNFT